MKNFDTELDVRGVTSLVVSQQVTVTPHTPRSRSMAHVGKPDGDWQWNDLRDYVVHEIEIRFGSFPRMSTKEYGIFQSFVKRWGPKAPAIARYAFETCSGEWRGQPVKVETFCKDADHRFAQPIADRLI